MDPSRSKSAAFSIQKLIISLEALQQIPFFNRFLIQTLILINFFLNFQYRFDHSGNVFKGFLCKSWGKLSEKSPIVVLTTPAEPINLVFLLLVVHRCAFKSNIQIYWALCAQQSIRSTSLCISHSFLIFIWLNYFFLINKI